MKFALMYPSVVVIVPSPLIVPLFCRLIVFWLPLFNKWDLLDIVLNLTRVWSSANRGFINVKNRKKYIVYSKSYSAAFIIIFFLVRYRFLVARLKDTLIKSYNGQRMRPHTWNFDLREKPFNVLINYILISHTLWPTYSTFLGDNIGRSRASFITKIRFH